MAQIISRAEVPNTWEHIVACCKDASVNSLAKLGRNEAQTKVYRAAMSKVKEEYAGVADYLKAKVFGTKTQPGPDGKLVAVDEQVTKSRIIWKINDFPYNFEPGIEHHLLWSTEPLSREEIDQQIAQRFPGYRTTYFVNPPQLQSVLAIWHAHVIVNINPQ